MADKSIITRIYTQAQILPSLGDDNKTKICLVLIMTKFGVATGLSLVAP
jgi:hypothetical protein